MILHLLFDAAQAEASTYEAKQLNPDNQSLYREKIEPIISLDSVAPYLFTFPQKTLFVKWFFEKGWGNGWGVIVQCSPNFGFEELYRHFRRFLIAKTEIGEELYFRFYDPRILRTFLPTCDANQLREFFGPLSHFYCEDKEAENTLVFSMQNSHLKTEKVNTAKLFQLHNTI